MTTEAPSTPLPADHAEVVKLRRLLAPLALNPHGSICMAVDRLATLITSQAEEIERWKQATEHWAEVSKKPNEHAIEVIKALQSDIERITKERDEAETARHELRHLYVTAKEDRDAAESSLATMTERCKELEEALGMAQAVVSDRAAGGRAVTSIECAKRISADITRALSQTTKGKTP